MDSNAVIDYLGGKLPAAGMTLLHRVVNAGPVVSVITKIEVLGYASPPDDAGLLSNFVNVATVLGLAEGIVDETIAIRKEHRLKTPDAIIAATARHSGMTLLTRNTADFKKVPGLKLLNPYEVE